MADIQHLFSDRALRTEEYKNKIILPTEHEFNAVKAFIDVFPDLVSLDYAPEKFMTLIGEFFDYPYLETEPEEVQREIYKRLVNIYKQKGSRGLFEKAVKYAHDENYALGDMTYYHNAIDPAVYTISYPRDKMFRYDYSHWDTHKYADARTVALGIVDIESDKFTPRVETYLDELIPAGIKYGVTLAKNMTGGGATGALVYPFKVASIINPYSPTQTEPNEKEDEWIFIDPSIPSVYIEDTNLQWDETMLDGDFVASPTTEDLRWMKSYIWDGRQVVSHEVSIGGEDHQVVHPDTGEILTLPKDLSPYVSMLYACKADDMSYFASDRAETDTDPGDGVAFRGTPYEADLDRQGLSYNPDGTVRIPHKDKGDGARNLIYGDFIYHVGVIVYDSSDIWLGNFENKAAVVAEFGVPLEVVTECCEGETHDVTDPESAFYKWVFKYV